MRSPPKTIMHSPSTDRTIQETKTAHRRMAKPTITSLPTETLNSILRHFCLHCCHGDTEGPDSYFRSVEHHQKQVHEHSWDLAYHRQPLVSLCLVSRRLRDVARQVLHHELVLGYGDPWRSASSSWDKRLTSDFAAAVRRVSLHLKLLEATELGDAAAVVELRRMGRGLGLEIPDESRPPSMLSRPPWCAEPAASDVEWVPDSEYDQPSVLGPRGKDLRMRYVDSYTSADSFRERHALGLEILAILMGTLPCVERLSIRQTVVDYDTPYLSALRSVGVNNRPRLIKILDLATHDYMLETMLQVPSQAAAILERAKDTLQALNLHMCSGFWNTPQQAPILRSLKTTRFTNSQLSAVQLGVLLSCCTEGLTSFIYEAATSLFALDTDSQFHPSEAIRSLRAHARTLKILHLDLRQVNSYSSFIATYGPGQLGGLYGARGSLRQRQHALGGGMGGPGRGGRKPSAAPAAPPSKRNLAEYHRPSPL